MKWLIVILLAPALAFATPDIVQSNDNNAQTTGDVVTGDSKAFAFAHSLGDVDINQCLGSTQWGTILVSKQKLVLNKWCAAEVYDAKGMHSMAARLRCQISEIKTLFNTHQSCILENTYEPIPVGVPTPGPDDEGTRPDAVGEVSKYEDQDLPDMDVVQHQIDLQEEEFDTLTQRVARIESGNILAARRAQQRRDYAQLTIERLENDREK